mmetsp:Transcript_30479/g.66808  ORF Transcript_30479/g.66808 Transcript_30479/m.66808 type:complete len:236 (-) Transcript_30479:586-1293(-)
MLVQFAEYRVHVIRVLFVPGLIVVGVDRDGVLLPLLHRAASVQSKLGRLPGARSGEAARRVRLQLVFRHLQHLLEESLCHGIGSALGVEHRALVEISRKELSLHSGGHANDSEVWSLWEQFPQHQQQKIGLGVALVHLIDHHVRDLRHRSLVKHHPEGDARRTVEQARALRALRLKPHLVADERALGANCFSSFKRHAARERRGRDATWLCANDVRRGSVSRSQAFLKQHLRDLR